jgi:hypothetical protein
MKSSSINVITSTSHQSDTYRSISLRGKANTSKHPSHVASNGSKSRNISWSHGGNDGLIGDSVLCHQKHQRLSQNIRSTMGGDHKAKLHFSPPLLWLHGSIPFKAKLSRVEHHAEFISAGVYILGSTDQSSNETNRLGCPAADRADRHRIPGECS